MARHKHTDRAIQRAASAYQKLQAARYGNLVDHPQTLQLAERLRKLAQFKVWKELSPELFEAHGGAEESGKPQREVDDMIRTYLRASIRPGRKPDSTTKLETGPMTGQLIYDPTHLERLAAFIRALASHVQPVHEAVQFVHRRRSCAR